MSIFRSISNAISQTADLTSATVSSLEKGIDTVNVIVNNNHQVITRTSKANAIERVANHHADLAKRLSKDSELKSIYEALEANWD